MNNLVELFNWTVTVITTPDNSILHARVDSKHKFGKSEEAVKLASAVTDRINEVLSPEVFQKIMLEAASDGASTQ